MIELDKELFTALNSMGTSFWDPFWLAVSDKWVALPLYVILLLMSYRILGTKKSLILLVAIALLITATDQLSNFFKYGVQRLRPCYDPELSETVRLVKSYCGGKFSYFSAHAANSWGIVGFFLALFKKRFPWFVPILILWGLLVGYSRIYLGVHFPLDVLSGMFAGLFLGWLIYRVFRRFIEKYVPDA